MTNEEHAAAGHIYVVGVDRICFWADPETLFPFSCGAYDQRCHSDPPTTNTMDVNEWNLLRAMSVPSVR